MTHVPQIITMVKTVQSMAPPLELNFKTEHSNFDTAPQCRLDCGPRFLLELGLSLRV